MTSGVGATGSSTEYYGPEVKVPDRLDSKETFLKLLIAQIRHQNPMQPADGMQFLSELSQFSQLEQLIGVREDIQAIRNELVPEADTSGETEGTETNKTEN